jgi:hypothetical protein
MTVPKCKVHQRKLEFSPEDFHNEQKELVFTALLKNHLIANGYLVATPEPDLGDDLWFVKRQGLEVRRGQIKSGHTAKCDHPTYLRQYSVKLQVPSLRKWMDKSGYVYFFAMADDRFHGLAEGRVEGVGDNCVLRVDKTRIIEDPTPSEFLRSEETKVRRIDVYRAEARGFHLGCIPCSFFKSRSRNWTTDANGVWVVLDDIESGVFRYRIGSDNITHYFGQTTRGLEDAISGGALETSIGAENVLETDT